MSWVVVDRAGWKWVHGLVIPFSNTSTWAGLFENLRAGGSLVGPR